MKKKKPKHGKYTALVRAAKAVCKTEDAYYADEGGEPYPQEVLDKIVPLRKAVLRLPR